MFLFNHIIVVYLCAITALLLITLLEWMIFPINLVNSLLRFLPAYLSILFYSCFWASLVVLLVIPSIHLYPHLLFPVCLVLFDSVFSYRVLSEAHVIIIIIRVSHPQQLRTVQQTRSDKTSTYLICLWFDSHYIK